MKFFKETFWGLIFMIILPTLCLANGPWERKYQDIKLPSQVVMEHYTAAIPVGASTKYLQSSGATNNGSATTFSSFLAQPDYPRNITITPGGSTGAVGAGTAVVSGLNIFGRAITENFTIGAGQSTAVTGSKAFKSVSSVVFPATIANAATIDIGVGVKLGLHRCLANAGDYVFSELNGVYDSTRGTVANSASAIESNTFSPNGSMDGTKPVDVFFLENYRCYP